MTCPLSGTERGTGGEDPEGNAVRPIGRRTIDAARVALIKRHVTMERH